MTARQTGSSTAGAYPPIVDTLACLARFSRFRALRRASLTERKLVSSYFMLCAVTRGGAPRRTIFWAAKSILIGSRDLYRSGLFNLDSMRSRLDVASRDMDVVFRKWIESGLPGCPVPGIADLAPDQPPERVLSSFLLKDAWVGSVPTDLRPNGQSRVLGYEELRNFLRELAPSVQPSTGSNIRLASDELFSDGEAALEEMRRRAMELHDRTKCGPMAEQIRKAAKLEPLINHPARGIEQFTIPPAPLLARVASFRRIASVLDHEPARSVVLVNRCGMSGAARVAGVLAHALAGIDSQYRPRDVVVIRTEQSDFDHPEWFPDGCRHLDFPALDLEQSPEGRKALLREVLRSLAPEQVFNVNSRLMWDSMTEFRKFLTDQSRLYAYLFCSDINMRGVEAGYPVEFFYRAISECTGVITDSVSLLCNLRERYILPETDCRLHSLKTPLLTPPAQVKFEGGLSPRRPRIYWAGRFDRQKRIDLLFDIAARMPNADFLVWGKPVLDAQDNMKNTPENVQLQGAYASFNELPLWQCDVWLYTSSWDGVPTLLIDVAAAGIPLVGSLVGGTGEVMVEGFAERLGPEADCDAYVSALNRTLGDLPAARSRARTLAELVISDRSLEKYRLDLRRILEVGAMGHG